MSSFLTTSPHLSKSGDSNTLDNNAINILTSDSIVTLNIAYLQVIQQIIADLQAAVKQNPHKRAPKHLQLKKMAPEIYWEENHQTFDIFFHLYEKNFEMDGCTQDKTRVIYASLFIHGTLEMQWKDYKCCPKHREPHIITWIDIKKKLCQQLGKEHVYIDWIYKTWQRAT